MTLLNIVCVLCLVYMAAIVATVIVKVCALDRKSRLKYLQNFKKGKFFLIYLVTFPLFWFAHFHNGLSPIGALFETFASAVDLVFLTFGFNVVEPLMTANALYSVTVYVCYALVIVNAAMLAFTIFVQKIFNAFAKRRAFTSKKTYVFVGMNDANRKILHSLQGVDAQAVVLDAYSKDLVDELYVKKVAFVEYTAGDLGKTLEKLFGRFDNKTVYVVVNTEDDVKDLLYVKQLAQVIYKQHPEENSIEDNLGLFVYVFGDSQNQSAFTYYSEKTNGCINYVNVFRLVAMDFVDRYPLSQFMTNKHIDTQTATIRPEVNLNVALIGFGRTNQQLFLTSVANNQFLTTTKSGLAHKSVQYFIYDKEDSENKNLNHSYYRYATERQGMNPEQYLPLPPLPANETYFKLDINDSDFYTSLKNNLVGENNYNYIVVALGADTETLDIGQKICSKIKEWGIENSTKVFIRIANTQLAQSVLNQDFADVGFVVFGDESNVVYNVKNIVDEKTEKMAKMRHLVYSWEYNSDKPLEEVKKIAQRDWFKQHSQIQRESNVYASLSLRTKLHMLGFDYTDNPNACDCSQQFALQYQQGDKITYGAGQISGKDKIVYTNDMFERASVRNTLAIQEHYRWNAFYLSWGIVPSSIDEICTQNKGKLLHLRKHGNLTTFEGLKQYRDLICTHYGKDPESADVIRYDYQLLDDAAWFLKKGGYTIVKKDMD